MIFLLQIMFKMSKNWNPYQTLSIHVGKGLTFWFSYWVVISSHYCGSDILWGLLFATNVNSLIHRTLGSFRHWIYYWNVYELKTIVCFCLHKWQKCWIFLRYFLSFILVVALYLYGIVLSCKSTYCHGLVNFWREYLVENIQHVCCGSTTWLWKARRYSCMRVEIKIRNSKYHSIGI